MQLVVNRDYFILFEVHLGDFTALIRHFAEGF